MPPPIFAEQGEIRRVLWMRTKLYEGIPPQLCARNRDTTPSGYHASSTRSLTFAATMTATACFAAYSGL
jgi:hypothetical protein